MTSSVSSQVLWGGLLLLLLVCLTIDLWIHRKPRRVPLADAATWTCIWIGLAVGVGGVVWALMGLESFLQFLASYAVEWSLSVDNVFVFILLMSSLAVPDRLRFRVLFLGSVGAIVLRLTFILAGSALLTRFDWLSYVFGALLLVAAVRFLREPVGEVPAEAPSSGISRLLRRWIPVAGMYDGSRLTTVVGGKRLATPLLLALMLVAITDLVFATDSIPAVFAMTRNPFIAVASNALAVIGLRSIYFLLEAVMLRLRYLKPALVALLVLIGLKMLAVPILDLEVPVVISLVVIVVTLGGAALMSWVLPKEPRTAPDH